jgi:hypothetical protein
LATVFCFLEVLFLAAESALTKSEDNRAAAIRHLDPVISLSVALAIEKMRIHHSFAEETTASGVVYALDRCTVSV